MKKRILSAALVLCLAFCAVCSAEGGVARLVNAADKLAFGTDNVTLNAYAKFLYDGEWFKTFTGEYRQDGENSVMIVSLDTPNVNGDVYTGGYTVVGNGTNVYFSETYQGNYYIETVGIPCRTVMRETPIRRGLMTMAQGAANLLNDSMAETVKFDNGVVTVKMSEAPALINGALSYIAARYIDLNYGYVSYIYDMVGTAFDNYEALGVHYYETKYGKKIDEDLLGRIYRGEATGDDWTVYDEIYYLLANEVNEITHNYTSGTVWFHNDGTYEWFETNEEYMRAAGIDYLYYDDYSATLRNFYAKKYGKELSEEALMALMYSTNAEFWEDYYEFVNGIDEYYNTAAAQNPETVALRIHPDGTYDELTRVEPPQGWTVTRQIAAQLTEMAFGNVDAEFTLSESGDALSGKGTAEFIVTDRAGKKHTLTVEFDCTAKDYGNTHVGAFDPKDYGLTTWEELVHGEEYEGEEQEYVEPEPVVLPETVEFGLKTYELCPADEMDLPIEEAE